MHSTLTRAHTCARVPIKPHPSLCQEKGLLHGSSEITAFWSPTPGSHSEHQSLSNSKGSLATEPGCEPRVPNGSRFHNRPLHHSPPGSCQHPQEPPGPAVVRWLGRCQGPSNSFLHSAARPRRHSQPPPFTFSNTTPPKQPPSISIKSGYFH